jgi:hypothetical protein
MKLSSTAGMQGIGWAQETFVGKASEAITKGLVVECLLSALEPDDDQSVAIANGSGFGIYAVALEDIASGERGLCCLSGKVEVQGGDTSGVGTPIMANSSGKVVALTGDDVVCVGLSVDILAATGLQTVLFDGFQPQTMGTA